MAATIVAAGAIGGTFWATNQPKPETKPVSVSTVPVASGDVVTEVKVPGTLQYSMTLPVVSSLGGVVTELPPPGSTVSAGAVLYRVNTQPVVMLAGTTPAWRDLGSGVTDGEDVRQLESNLKTFGFFSGEPDRRFTSATSAAVMTWQKQLGIDRTGVIPKSTILFSDQNLLIGDLASRVGAQVSEGAALFQATSALQVAEVAMKSVDRALAVPGTGVKIALPSGASIDGAVESVKSPTAKTDADGQGSTIVVPVRIAITDQDAVRDLVLANVTVSFISSSREGVLTVPVDALLPIDDANYAVEVPRTHVEDTRRLIPVTVGAFSSGNVEISGDGIIAGLNVVVPTR